MSSLPIVILCALPQEFDALCQRFQVYPSANSRLARGGFQGKSILIAETGIGMSNSALMTTKIIEQFSPSILLFVGIAGAVDSSLQIGDVVISEMVFQAEAISHQKFASHWQAPVVDMKTDTSLLDIAKKVAKQPKQFKITTGVIVSSETFPTPENYQAEFQQKETLGIDMESAAFYQVCKHYNKPCLSIRSISNPVTQELRGDDILVAAQNAADTAVNVLEHGLQKITITSKAYTDPEIKKIIENLGLIEHPEGGYYQRTFTSNYRVKLAGPYAGTSRHCSTAIYYLLAGNDYSAWHRIKADEMWHFYSGTSLLIHYFANDQLNTIKLGNPMQDIDAVCQFTIPAQCDFAAELIDPSGFALLGCTVTPGFDFADFEFSDTTALQQKHPENINLINKLVKQAV